jgi:hypothetical protein
VEIDYCSNPIPTHNNHRTDPTTITNTNNQTFDKEAREPIKLKEERFFFTTHTTHTRRHTICKLVSFCYCSLEREKTSNQKYNMPREFVSSFFYSATGGGGGVIWMTTKSGPLLEAVVVVVDPPLK